MLFADLLISGDCILRNLNFLFQKQIQKSIKNWQARSCFTAAKNNKVLANDFELSEEFVNLFEKAVQSLNIKPNESFLKDTDINDPVEIVIKKL